MTNISKLIRENNLIGAKSSVLEMLDDIFERNKVEYLKDMGARLFEEYVIRGDQDLSGDEDLTEARFKIVRVRIRKGKIQRRKKVSTVKGFTFRNGKLIKMSPKERRNRKLGQRRGKIKRRAKLNKSLAKRRKSLRKRNALGAARS